MPEAITSQLSGGAGRYVDEYWPDRGFWRANGVNPNQTIYGRLGALYPGSQTATFSLNPNPGFNMNINGRSGATVGAVSGGVGNGLQLTFNPWTIHVGKRGVGVHNPPPNLAGLDPFGAYRVTMIASFASPAGPLGTAVDNGLEICACGGGASDDGRILMMGTPGFGFRVYDADKCEVFMRAVQAGAVTRVDVATPATGYACGDWHCYEIRIVGAQGSQEAVAKFYIDGVLLLTLAWGPGNIMPEINNGREGFIPNVVTTGGTLGGFTVDIVTFQAAKDELNLL